VEAWSDVLPSFGWFNDRESKCDAVAVAKGEADIDSTMLFVLEADSVPPEISLVVAWTGCVGSSCGRQKA
jgi:hypothetical protein